MFKVKRCVSIIPHLWHKNAFIEPKTVARDSANHAFEIGEHKVELPKKSREGYTIIKKAIQLLKQSNQRCGEWMAEDAPCFI